MRGYGRGCKGSVGEGRGDNGREGEGRKRREVMVA